MARIDWLCRPFRTPMRQECSQGGAESEALPPLHPAAQSPRGAGACPVTANPCISTHLTTDVRPSVESRGHLRPGSYLGVEGHIGRTPLLRLRRVSELTGCEILAKAEFMNPGGSVKDRAALGIIEDAEARGLLRLGATIVEGTAGNTGIGLTMVGQAKGYRTGIVIPD